MRKNQIGRWMLGLLMSILLVLPLCMTTSTKVEAATGVLTGKTAMEINDMMGFGINIGNSLEATSNTNSWNNSTGDSIYNQETCWGNPVVSKTLLHAIKERGFQCVRVPITWMNYVSKDGNYTIDSAWLNRVKALVDDAYEEGLFVIINSHHDYWSENTDFESEYEQDATITKALWTQIADYFADYDQHLIFEGMNEPTDWDGNNRDWTGNSECYRIVNYLNQVFVDAVRSCNKGYNSERLLMVQGYAASNSASIMSTISIPTYKGESAGNIAVSIHCYSPYLFCQTNTQSTFDKTSASDTSAIDSMFEAADQYFLSNNIPVIIGEIGANDVNGNTAERIKWANYVFSKAVSYGMPALIWDNGHVWDSSKASNDDSNKECYNFVNRSTGAWYFPTLMKAIFNTKENGTWGALRGTQSSGNVSEYLPASTLNENVYKSSSGDSIDWHNYVPVPLSPSLFYEGRSIAIVYTGDAPVLAMSSESFANKYKDSDGVNYWWMQKNADSTSTVGSYKVAYYEVKKIEQMISQYHSMKTSDLSAIQLTGNGAQVYEINSTGSSYITFMANGQVYYSGTQLPATNPTAENYTFIGWYTTIDYQAGTEFTDVSQATGFNQTVYAKFIYSVDEIVRKNQTITTGAASYSLKPGNTARLNAKTSGNGTLTYKSQNTSVATVSSAGVITAKGVGTTTIQISAAQTSQYKAATKTITVKVLPSKVTGVTVQNITGGFSVSWNASAGATAYYIYRNGSYIAKVNSGTTTYTDRITKSNGSVYQYTVAAVAATGTGEQSSAATIVFLSRNKFTKAANLKKGIQVTWTKNAKATGYILYRSKNGGKYVKVVTLKGANNTTYSDAKANTNGSTYRYRVLSYYKTGSALYKSELSATRTIGRVSAVTIKSAKNLSGRKIKLTWAKNSKATGYQIRIKTGTTTKNAKVTNYKTVSKLFTGLKKGSTYQLQIRAYKKVGSKYYYSTWTTKKVTVKK